MKFDNSGHAYPVSTIDGYTQHGLTKRELFAAMAMQGYCAVHEGWDETPEEIARCSARIADALLAELERTA